MANTQNSISSLIAQFLRLQTNSLQIINSLADASTSTNSTVNIPQLNSDNSTSNVSVPSWGYMLNKITTLDNNIQTLAGLNNGTSNVRNPDGTVSQIILSKPLMDPPAPTSLAVPSNFSTKTNWFFDNFLNPSLYVTIPLDGQVPAGTTKVYVKRIIANTVTATQKSYFDTNLSGKNDISLDDFLSNLNSQGINYFSDESTVELPLQLIRYKGNFSVLRVIDQVVTTTNNGIATQQTIRRYKLDTIAYTDSLATGTGSSRQLIIGDVLITPGGTKYQIIDLNVSELTVTLNRINGYDPITIGANSLAIDSEILSPLQVDIKVGHDERQGVFVKSINDNFNVAGSTYSNCVCFWSNNLTINTSVGVMNLDSFYQQYVSDFSSILLANSKENVIPSIYASTPQAPLLLSSNFQVLVANTQITQSSTNTKFQTQIQSKTSIKNNIDAINTSIAQIQNQIVNQSVTSVSKTFKADTQTLLQKVTNLTQQKTTQTELLASTIQDIANISTTNPEINSTPIYRVRGFWAFPPATQNPKTGPQEVIQFRIRYRYLSSDGNAPAVTTIPFTDSNGNKYNGAFSNWTEYKTDIRKKVYDTSSGNYIWAVEDVTDPDNPAINQIDIPISKGESVEIAVASISEGGWPLNASESDFSTSVVVKFPDSLTVTSNNTQYLQANTGDQAVATIQADLTAKGLDNHLSDSFTTANKYYSHITSSISSGFFDAQGNPIDLLTQLQSMVNQIAGLTALISQAKGILGVYITIGSTTNQIKNGQTVNLFAGYYDELLDLTNVSNYGKIASVTYQLELRNDASTPLELASLIPGGQSIPALSSTSPLASVDYATNRNYDLTPLSITSIQDGSIVAGLTGTAAFIQAAPYQSGNSNSQFIYPRYKTVGFDSNIYFPSVNPTGTWSVDTGITSSVIGNVPSNQGILIPYMPGSTLSPGSTSTNIWNGTYTSGLPLGGGNLNEFCIHYQHPTILNEALQVSPRAFLDLIRPVETTGSYEYPEFRHTLGFELGSNDTIATDITSQTQVYQQMEFTPPANNSYGSTGTDNSYPLKLGFSGSDEFLVGKYSCGAYLFMAPSNHTSIQVEGSTSIATTTLDPGEQNSIVVPIVFQFRCADKLQYVGGFRESGSIRNITYTKKVGIDIQVQNSSLFSFDLVISGSYTRTAIATPSYASSRVTTSL